MALAGLTACGDKVELTQAPTPVATKDSSVQSVSVTPSTAQIQVNGTQLFVANVVGGKDLVNRNVTWTSSNTAVATVDANGLATAKGPGQTTIVATSAANTAVKGAAVLTVAAVTPASLSFFGVNNQAGAPATLNNANGQLNVIANVDPGQSGLRNVQLIGIGCRTGAAGDTAIIATAPISGSTGTQTQQQVTLAFPTATFNSTTGATTYTNGNCQLAIRGLDASGAVIPGTLASGPALTLNNTNSAYGTIIATKAAADAAGLSWNDGDVTVAVYPVIYSRGVTIASSTPGTVTLSVAGAGAVAPVNATKALTANANGGFSATFTEATDLAGAQGNPMTASATLVDNTGNTYTGAAVPLNTQASVLAGGATAASIRYDNVAPPTFAAVAIPGVSNGAFVGTAQTFPTSTSNAAFTGGAAVAADNSGVDKVTVTYQYTTSTGAYNGSSVVWTNFTSGADLPGTSTATGTGSYTIRVTTCDALGNCSYFVPGIGSVTAATTTALSGATRIGADPTAPLATVTAVPAQGEIATTSGGLTGGGNLTVSVADPQNANGTNGSGFTGTPLNVTISRVRADTVSGGTICINPNTGAASAPGASGCASVQTTSSFALPAAPGVYTITFTAQDQAGNTTTATTRTYVVDGIQPVVNSGVAIPASITSGTAFTATATDNIAVSAGAGSLAYASLGANRKSFALSGTASPLPASSTSLNGSATISVIASPFFRSLQVVTANATATAGTAKPDSVVIRAVDEAGNISTGANAQQVALPAANIATGTAFTVGALGAASTQVNDFTVTATPSTLSNGTGTGTRATSLNAAVALAQPGSTAQSPFTQVCFYYVSTGTGGTFAGDLVQIGCTSSVVTTTQTVGATQYNIINYSTTWDPAAFLGSAAAPGTPITVYAVGSNTNGDALVSQSATVNLVP